MDGTVMEPDPVLRLLPEIRDPVLIFALVLLILLVAPALLSRARLPGLLGLIVAGILVGPHGLGLLARDGTFELLGAVGLLYLMFLAGLEIELRQFVRERKHSLVFGALTFLIPQVLGTIGAVYLLNFSWVAGILLASMFASHTLITFGIVRGMGLTKNRPVMASIGGTILTDTAALLVLAIVSEYTQGKLDGPGFWLRQMTLLVLCVAGLLYVLPIITRWFFKHFRAAEEAEFIFILAAVFISAVVAELAGVEPIIGAFLAGLSLGRFTPEEGALRNRIEFVGHALFIPFFLLSVGMLVDLRVLFSDYRSWMVMLYMSVAVVLCKWLAAGLSGRILGWNKHERGLVFGITVNQAAATLAAVLVGYRLDIFDEAVLNGTIMMILTSCLIGSLVTERYARRVLHAEEVTPLPAPEENQRLLMALGNPEKVPALTDLALLLRKANAPDPLYPLTVVADDADIDTAIARGEKMLSEAVRRALGAGVHSNPLVRVDYNIAAGIQHAASEYRAAMILLGWSGRPSTWRNLFRHTIHDLLVDARSTIAVYRPGAPLNTVETVWALTPPFVERHPGFSIVVQHLRRLARRLQSRLVFVTERTRVASLRAGAGDPPQGVPEAFEPLASWNEAAQWAENRLGARDLAAVIGVRAGWRTWQPLIDRLPVQISVSKPECNLLLLYPSAMRLKDRSAYTPSATGEQNSMIPSRHVRTDLDGLDLEGALAKLIHGVYERQPQQIDALIKELTAVSRQYPVELAPGVLLLHTHSGTTPDVCVMLGVSKNGIPVTGLDARVHLLLVVVAGQSLPAEDYLKALSELSRMLQKPGVIEQLTHLSSPEEIDAILAGPETRS